jgi:uncharacterized protein
MPVSRAHVPTTSAARYMVQLCKHWSHKLNVAYDDRTGRIEFDTERRGVLHALPDGLEMEVEAANDEQLARTQNTLVTHLKRFAFREDIGEVQWRRLD